MYLRGDSKQICMAKISVYIYDFDVTGDSNSKTPMLPKIYQ